MRRLGLPPSDANTWFQTIGERMSVYSGANDPTVAEVPENQWIVYLNTTVPEVRIWTNIAGVLKKSAAFT
jgi:hypothetical protein